MGAVVFFTAQAFDGFFAFGEFVDVSEDEFAFAACVAGVDDLPDVLACHQLFEFAELFLGVGDGLEFEFFGDDGEVVEAPGF